MSWYDNNPDYYKTDFTQPAKKNRVSWWVVTVSFLTALVMWYLILT